MAKAKLVLKGTIELLSPALIGCGRDDRTDMDVLLDTHGKPFIPATSFIGVLRHFIKLGNGYENDLKRFWGFTSQKKISDTENEQQSSVCCNDLSCQNYNDAMIVNRDGVSIDSKKGIAESGAKFDFEVVEWGAKFGLHMEISFTEKTQDFSLKMLATICDVLKSEKIHIGTKTNNGLGKLKLSHEAVHEFSFENRQDVISWLKDGDYSRTISINSVEKLPIKGTEFIIEATFLLKNSLIIRSYPTNPLMPDAVHIQSNGKPVLTGTSLKGTIRSRAERILNTIGKSQNVLKELFGDVVVDKNNKKRAKRGRIRIDEVVLPRYDTESQTRIKIDRFTGGTTETALFDTMPLFSDGDNDKQIKDVRITIRDCKGHEAGLMLLVLKDLWTGDLAVGGEKSIGRGVFEGIHAEIAWNNETATIKKGLEGLLINNKDALEKFISTLNNIKEADNGKE